MVTLGSVADSPDSLEEGYFHRLIVESAAFDQVGPEILERLPGLVALQHELEDEAPLDIHLNRISLHNAVLQCSLVRLCLLLDWSSFLPSIAFTQKTRLGSGKGHRPRIVCFALTR